MLSVRKPNQNFMSNMKDSKVNSTKRGFGGKIMSTVNMIDLNPCEKEIKTILKDRFKLFRSDVIKRLKAKKQNIEKKLLN